MPYLFFKKVVEHKQLDLHTLFYFYKFYKNSIQSYMYMGLVVRKPDFVACEEQMHSIACASAQSDQCLCHL